MSDAAEPTKFSDARSTQMETRARFSGDFWRGFHATKSPDVHLDGQVLVKEMGPIDQMTLSGDWTGGSPEYGRTSPAYIRRTYQHADDPQAILKYNDRGLRIPKTDGSRFEALLSEPFDKNIHAHEIRDPESLKTSQSRVLNFMDPDNIALEKASVLEIGDKRVLMVRGEYKATNKPFLKMYVPADESGTAIRELEYQAPANVFSKYLDAIQEAFWSIKWRTEN